jgi:hypothetical protein
MQSPSQFWWCHLTVHCEWYFYRCWKLLTLCLGISDWKVLSSSLIAGLFTGCLAVQTCAVVFLNSKSIHFKLVAIFSLVNEFDRIVGRYVTNIHIRSKDHAKSTEEIKSSLHGTSSFVYWDNSNEKHIIYRGWVVYRQHIKSNNCLYCESLLVQWQWYPWWDHNKFLNKNIMTFLFFMHHCKQERTIVKEFYIILWSL